LFSAQGISRRVPFELIPFKVEGGKPQPPTPPANHVYADAGKVAFEIEFPVVEGYQDPGLVNVVVVSLSNWVLVAARMRRTTG
jgi:hypothetical protein